MHNYQYSLYPITSIFKAIKNVVNIKQDDKEYLEAFTKRFNNYKDIMETQHGNLTLSKYIKTLPGYDSSKIEKVKLDSEWAYEKFVAYNFIQGIDHRKMVRTEDDLANQFTLSFNSYPCNVPNKKNMIINYKNYVNNPNHPGKKKQQLKKYSEK